MLRVLRIRNLAVIESASVEFGPGFTVLTGETGAGKSILIEAVGLLLGGRASADLVRTGETLAWIEAVFEDADAGEVVVRRELSHQGRSRSFINGTLATAGALRELANRLVDMHGQHEHHSLIDPSTHLALLDEYAHPGPLAATVEDAWSTVASLRALLDRATMGVREREARLDLIAFQIGEIEKVRPVAREDEELSATRQVLASAERVQRLCVESFGALYESDQSVLAQLAGVRKRITELAAIDPAFAAYIPTADSMKSELEDLAWFVRDYGDRIDASPERLQQVEDRLASIERLKRKYGPTLDQVLEAWQSLTRERELLTSVGDDADGVRRKLDAASTAYLESARRLSAVRRAAAPRLSADLEQLLGELAMEGTRFSVQFNDMELAPASWAASGIDRAEFLISPNVGEDLRPLARVVSGGELSRVMLALKTLVARRARLATSALPSRSVRTLIFDEVDAGIGGHVADAVGARLADLGAEFQVLCITHLPQIAARGTTHLHIAKTVARGRTRTTITALEGDVRVEEVARMIGGVRMSDAVRASARELMSGEGRERPRAKGESESRAGGESRRKRP